MMKVSSSYNLPDDEFGIEDIEFEIHYRQWERNRMYPIRDTRRMSRAAFLKHTLYNRLNRKRRKES